MMEASLSWRHAKAQRWAQGCKMGRDGALPARRLLNKANKLLRDGTVEGAKKAYAQLKSIQGEVGNDRAMRNHVSNCIGVCAETMIKLDETAQDQRQQEISFEAVVEDEERRMGGVNN